MCIRDSLWAACDISRKYQAEGIMLTNWGDCGNHQPWATLYPPLFLGAQLAWSGKKVTDEQIGSAVDHYVFKSPSFGLGYELINLARLDPLTGFHLPNNSLPWFALFSAQPEKLPRHLEEHTNPEKIKRGLDWLNALDAKPLSSEKTVQGDQAEREWRLGIELSKIGLQHAFSQLNHGTLFPKTNDLNLELIEKFQEIWLVRARIGGLHEAVALLEKALQKTNRA